MPTPRKPLAKRRRTAANERIYAIGDIHGRYDLLRQLLRQIEHHERGLGTTKKLHLVLLGDVIDRGPESAAILRFLRDWAKNTRGQFVLLGNHEEIMLRVHAGETRLLDPWLRMGGRETLQSFGIAAPEPGSDFDPRLMNDIFEALTPELMEFVRKWPLVTRSGDYYFCHAGVRPGIDLTKQARSDLLWIREEFLASSVDHGATIVHGHSITLSADIRSNRMGIDTGAFCTGVLTALYLEDGDWELLSTTGADACTPRETA
ncbi:metallophosphoesterase family protein [Novosphingobium album (ex Liu et al. 2023)]|uniref:Metallophosphoesterase family protein n=1 Tax=Novosphingobium album (ex Liu et al. 2023) TaxID=3031130 RepID=A0ABT5WQH9_9SPHN|nr:metallophosphoesterase family protein [Novosphingobium album (ex Liu et al. 2023)]MDE8652300.1 metallophosphoesterase family protein [Novosphingobium album (ex Liu et al. 2023)]